MTDNILDHLPYLETVVAEDVRELRRKELTYNGSWRKNGGVHAWHMIQRKFDRLLHMLAPLTDSDQQNLRDAADCVVAKRRYNGTDSAMAALFLKAATAEDIFALMLADTSGADGTVLAEIRDARRYLLLCEAWLVARTSGSRSNEVAKAAIVDMPISDAFVDRGCKLPVDWSGNQVSFTATDGTVYSGTAMRDGATDWYFINIDSTKFGTFYMEGKHLRPMDPVVPAEDSNRHADRATERDQDIGHWVENTKEWKVLPFITVDRWARIQSKALRERYIGVGDFAIVDRRLYTPEKREIFAKLPQTLTATDYLRIREWERGLYEKRPGVVGEYQLRSEFREAWGQ